MYESQVLLISKYTSVYLALENIVHVQLGMRCTFLLIYFNTSFLYISIRKQQAHEAHRSSDQQFLTIDNRGKLSSYVHLKSEKKLKYF